MPEQLPLLMRRLHSVHHALQSAGFDHAVGGALALAIHVEHPRFTADIDMNVIADPEQPHGLLHCLPAELTIHSAAASELRQLGQTRLTWEAPRTPLDLFLPMHDTLHQLVNDRAAPVDFAGVAIPAISATDLAIFKTMFGRPQDWVDIASLIETGKVDDHEAITWVSEIVGREDPRVERLKTLVDGAET